MVPIIGSITGLVSYLDEAWLLWDQRRQCLHDKIADTVVEQKPPRR
ncbi:MAG: RDD family protein [Actinomycetales bacterium]|nr:RDD family protein [Candidatus Phosphoribacter baldrii]